MKHINILRSVVMLQVVILAISVFCCSLFVEAETTRTISFETDTSTVTPGDNLVVKVKSNEPFSAASLSIDISFDTAAFSVSKLKVPENYESNVMSGVSNNKLSINWISETDVETWASGTMFEIHLKSNSIASGDKSFSFAKVTVLDSNLNNIEFNTASELLISLKAAEKSEKVKNAEEKINAIGTVSADIESLNRITEAELAYYECSASEKLQVENRDILTQAIYEYNRLKEQQAIEENQQKLESEIAKFKEDHKNVLALSVSTVKGSDVAALNAAIIEYGTKIPYIKNILKPEYDKLLELYQLSSQMATAPEMVESFRSTYSGVLELSPDTLAYSDEESFNDIRSNIEAAIATYNNYNDVAKSNLSKEYELLIALNKRCDELAVENSPEPEYVTVEYNSFRNKYLSLLLKTEGEVTTSDLSEIQNALSELKSLKPAVRGKLMTEYEHLMNLLQSFDNVSEVITEPGDTIIELVQVPVEKIIEKPVEKIIEKEAEVSAKNTEVSIPSSGRFGMIVFLMMLTAFILFAIPVLTYFILKFKSEREKINNGNDI